MRKFFRPSFLIAVTLSLALAAAVLVFWPATARTQPRPVPAGDQEIVWLNTAVSAVSWERFVAAVYRLQHDRPELGLKVVADSNVFPSQTANVPELAVTVGDAPGRLWFRWYKLTGDLPPGAWLQALASRRPPPLTVIGGGSTDRAVELAKGLQALTLASPPLLLITTATADQVRDDLPRDGRLPQTVPLMKIFAGRSFRFCFTNHQMAEAVSDFVWSQDDLRPDAEPVYLVDWKDDPYSMDLFQSFQEIWGPGRQGQLLRAPRVARWVQAWGLWSGRVAAGGLPLGLELEELAREEPAAESPLWTFHIPYSVGSHATPNSWEAKVAELIVSTEQSQVPTQQRPLLLLPANPNSGRRFLRALVQTAPADAGRFVVATGDGIDFNTLYRDRNVSWSIQDLPLALVAFCHRNPVDPEAFQPDQGDEDNPPPDPRGKTSTGTQDLLLNRDIVEAVVEAAFQDGRLVGNADELGERLRRRTVSGRQAFDADGNQQGGLGEYVVCLRPMRQEGRVLPRARLQVYYRSAEPGGTRSWERVPVAGQPELTVEYAPGPRAQPEHLQQ